MSLDPETKLLPNLQPLAFKDMGNKRYLAVGGVSSGGWPTRDSYNALAPCLGCQNFNNLCKPDYLTSSALPARQFGTLIPLRKGPLTASEVADTVRTNLGSDRPCLIKGIDVETSSVDFGNLPLIK